jgi:hypothetical protein
MRLTTHAKSRVRARGCNALSLELIRRFGHGARTSSGAWVWIANKRERGLILDTLKAAQRDFEKQDPPYFVEAADGAVVTVGRRTRKIRRR